MVVIFNSDESERLQHALSRFLHGAEDFGHAMNRASLSLKGDFNEVALRQRLRQAQQSAGCGNGLKFRFRAAAVFETDRSQDGIA